MAFYLRNWRSPSFLKGKKKNSANYGKISHLYCSQETILQGGHWKTKWYETKVTFTDTCLLNFVLFYLEI